MEKQWAVVRKALVIGALIGLLLGAGAVFLYDRSPLGQTFSASAPGIQSLCPGEIDFRETERLRSAARFVEDRYGVTLNYVIDLYEQARYFLIPIPPEAFAQATEGHRAAVLYNYSVLAGCVVFDFAVIPTERAEHLSAQIVLVRPAGDGWEVVAEHVYWLR